MQALFKKYFHLVKIPHSPSTTHPALSWAPTHCAGCSHLSQQGSHPALSWAPVPLRRVLSSKSAGLPPCVTPELSESPLSHLSSAAPAALSRSSLAPPPVSTRRASTGCEACRTQSCLRGVGAKPAPTSPYSSNPLIHSEPRPALPQKQTATIVAVCFLGSARLHY